MRTRIFLLCTATVFAGITQAQAPQPALTPQAAFDSFLRVAATVGKPSVALRQALPISLASSRSPDRFMLTAAHAVVVTTEAEAGQRDTTARISRVMWVERVADTVALRRRVGEVVGQLERVAGAVDRCADPIGPPAYLFAPQRVARLWRRGVAGQPTQLVWEVGAGADYSITVTVGQFADNGSAMYSCDGKRE